MANSIHIFPDTNVLLHYPPLAHIDWPALCGSETVTLVICLEVIRELDAKKSDSRLSDRANRAIKEIREATKTAKSIRNGVSVVVFNQQLLHEDFSGSNLSPSNGDDRIVHQVRQYRASMSESVAVVTEDLGMELRCEAGGVSVIHMDTSLRLDNPHDELTKRHKQAVQELASLKNRQPKLRLTAKPPDATCVTSAPPIFELDTFVQPIDIDDQIKQLERKYPRRLRAVIPDEASGTLRKALIAEQQIYSFTKMISEDQWKAYGKRRDAFIKDYRTYLENLNLANLIKAHCMTITFMLHNDGNGLATDIDIEIDWPDLIGYVAIGGTKEASFIEKLPEPPDPPEPPKSMIESLQDNARFATRSYMDFMPQLNQLDFSGGSGVYVSASQDSDKRWHTHIQVQRLKHGHKEDFVTVYAVVGRNAELKPFDLSYKITAVELTDKVVGRLPLILRHVDDKGKDAEEAEVDTPE